MAKSKRKITSGKRPKKVSATGRSVKVNDEGRVSIDSLKFPAYDQIHQTIEEKIGKRPSLPKNLAKGEWSQQALRVLRERYLKKDKFGKVIETPEEMCWRVAWEIASAESTWGKDRREVADAARKFYNLLISHEFLPNSPTLMNAGTQNNLQYSACFVLPVEDSLVGIFDSIKYQALIHQSGGGTGFSFSRLRPSGAVVKSSGGVASGPVSFMRIFDAATNEIKQGGKRRGANMGILRVDHPDIMEFIHCKDVGGITNFNISVAITDKFMKAYEKQEEYDLIDPRTKEVVGSLSAQKVFDEIAESAWKTGDPGLVFIDRMNQGKSHPVPAMGDIEATNPCGEQPLYPYDACNLGSIFLTYFVIDNSRKKEIDWDKLKEVVRLSVRFLDNVIEVNPYPLDEIRKTVLGIRRIGLGVGGWADMLAKLGIAYDSDEALELGKKVMGVIENEADLASKDLAKERGPFPLFPLSIYKSEEERRNSTVTTIAPTGSISIIANSSSGIEPFFAIAFQHIVKDRSLDRTLTFVNPLFEEEARKRNLWNKSLEEKVTKKGTVRNIEDLPEDLKAVFGTAHEIHHNWHIKMQAAFQESTENAVSKTINMDHKVSDDEIKDAYLLAWKSGCKGITVFRDGCKDHQVLNLGIKDEKAREDKEDGRVWERPMIVNGATYKMRTPVGTAFITVNQDERQNPIEVFINVGRAGSDVQAMAEALGRVISKSLNFASNLSSKERALVVVDQLKGIGGRRSIGFGANKIRSLPDAVAIALGNHLGLKINGDSEKAETNLPVSGNGVNGKADGISDLQEKLPLIAGSDENAQVEFKIVAEAVGDICPSCGASSLVYEENCMKCYSCGHSEC